jgi:hypothetical protein
VIYIKIKKEEEKVCMFVESKSRRISVNQKLCRGVKRGVSIYGVRVDTLITSNKQFLFLILLGFNYNI